MGKTTKVKDVIDRTFHVPENVYIEAEIKRAKETLFNYGIKPNEYEEYFAEAYAKEAIADHRMEVASEVEGDTRDSDL